MGVTVISNSTVEYRYTGSTTGVTEQYTWTVPAGITSVVCEAWGGQGGGPLGGKGGYVRGRLSVTPGQVLTLRVGNRGRTNEGSQVTASGGVGSWVGSASTLHAAGGGGQGGWYNGEGTSNNPADDVPGGDGGGLVGGDGGGVYPGRGGSQTSNGLPGGGTGNTVRGSGGAGFFNGGAGGQRSGGGGGSSKVPPGGTTEAGINADVGRVRISTNVPPFAADQLSPNGKAIPSDRSNPFNWVFSDENEGDTQSKADIRHRATGTETWTYEQVANLTRWDPPAGTFSPGNHGWQVLPYDSQGVPAPAWSALATFDAAPTPPGPVPVSPGEGAVISLLTQNFEWSAPVQNAYQVRVLADDGDGNPDEDTVIYDSGQVNSTTTRAVTLEFPTNLVDRHLQVRILTTIWSPWASVHVTVSYTPPTVPRFTVVFDTVLRHFVVSIVNPPPPNSGTPAVVTNWVYVRANGGPWELQTKTVAPQGMWRHKDPAAYPVEYEYRVVAIGSNGTTTDGIEVTPNPGGYEPLLPALDLLPSPTLLPLG